MFKLILNELCFKNYIIIFFWVEFISLESVIVYSSRNKACVGESGRVMHAYFIRPRPPARWHVHVHVRSFVMQAEPKRPRGNGGRVLTWTMGMFGDDTTYISSSAFLSARWLGAKGSLIIQISQATS